MKPLTLALTGLEQDDITDFRRIFGKLRSQLKADWRLVDDADADLSVVDIDSIYGHMDWLKLTGSGMCTAVYTSAQYAKESDLVLFKPLKAENLADVLGTVAAQRVGSNVITNVIDTPARAPKRVDNEQTRPQPEAVRPQTKPVQHVPVVEKAVFPPLAAPASREIRAVKPQPKVQPVDAVVADSQSNEMDAEQPDTVGAWLLSSPDLRSVRIASGDDVWILDSDRGGYYGPATLKSFDGILETSPDSLRDVDVVELGQARKGSAQPLVRLRWYAGLKSSPGKLNPALQASKTFKLARWPQIEREFPRHFRIATAMMKQAGSVAELSQASGAPEQDVADFINASHAIGIVEYSGAGQAAATPASGGVMSRLRSSLGR